MAMFVKKHQQPDFQIIRQVESNAKFFVASGGFGGGQPSGGPAHSAAQYTEGQIIEM